jgi:hypothetical protein
VGWEIKVIQVNLNSLGWGLVTKRLMEMELRRAITLAEPFFLSGSGVMVVQSGRLGQCHMTLALPNF